MSSPIMRYFAYKHLSSEVLQDVSKEFVSLATYLDKTLPDNMQKDAALQHLLIAKDAAVRSALDLPEAL